MWICPRYLSKKNARRTFQLTTQAKAEVEVQRAMLRHTYISVNKEMPAGPKKMVVGHSKDMDTESVYGHELAGGLEKAANYTEQAFGEIIGKK